MVERFSTKWFLYLFAACFLLAAALAFAPLAGDFLYKKGLQAKAQWRIDAAIRFFDWAAVLQTSAGEARFEKALCLQLQGEFSASQTELEKTGEPEINARILNAKGVNFFNSNQPDEALVHHQKSLEIARKTQDRTAEANALIDLSRVLYHSKGKFGDAQKELEKALQIGRETRDEAVIADALRNLGVVFWWGKGELERPLNDFYKPALALYRKRGDRRGEATTLSNISLIYSFKSDVFQSLKLQNESLAIRTEIGDKAGLSDSFSALGTLFLKAKNLRKARDYFQKSFELSKQIGYLLTQNDAETYLAGVSVELGEFDAAIALFEQLLTREKTNPILAKYRIASIAYCYRLKNDFENARKFYEQAFELEISADSPDKRSLESLLILLGDTYRHLNDRQKAAEFFAQAEEIIKNRDPDDLHRSLTSYVTLAEFKQSAGKNAEALSLLEEFADFELKIFAAAGTNLIDSPPPRDYDRLFKLLLENLKTDDDSKSAEELAFRFLEQRRYRSLKNFIVQTGGKREASAGESEKAALAKIEKFAGELKQDNSSALLRENLRLAYIEYENAVLKSQFSVTVERAINAARPARLEKVRENLSEETALVEYIFAGERVFALVLTRENLRSFQLPATRSNLKNKTRLLSSLIFSKNDAESKDWQPIAESLRRNLIEPVESSQFLKNKKRLAIIPFGFLHELPFAALTKTHENEPHFLVEDYILFYPPSASFLSAANNSDNLPPEMLSFGRNNSSEADLPDLKFAVEEASAVARIFSGAAKLETEANETEFKRLAPNAAFLHVAAHAVAEPEMPLLSRLNLEPTAEDDGNLTAREIFELGIKAKLVALAACEGAQSFSADSEQLIEIDRIGLTEAFIHAGAGSVLASLSPVSDKRTTEFMKDFYANLLTKDKAESLAAAQRKMLTENFKHPRFWSPFILVGADR